MRDRDAAVLWPAQARYGLPSVALGVPRRGGDAKDTVPAGTEPPPHRQRRDVQRAPMSGTSSCSTMAGVPGSAIPAIGIYSCASAAGAAS